MLKISYLFNYILIMEVKIKKTRKDAIIPTYAKPGDAGMDLYAVDYEYDASQQNHIYNTGIALEIPEGYVGLVFPRSSNRKTECYMTNHVGVIDSGYRGTVYVTFKNRDEESLLAAAPYGIKDKIAQLIIMPYPHIELVEVDKLSETERGEGGHGSTGR